MNYKFDSKNVKEYLDWIYSFLQANDSISEDNLVGECNISDNDKNNIQKLENFASYIEYLSFSRNMKMNYYHLYKSNVIESHLYYIYKKRKFVIVTMIGVKPPVLIKVVRRKIKHKFLNLDGIIT